MTTPIDAPSADAAVSTEEENAPIIPWSLDELDRLLDLDSVRAARGHTDEPVC